MRRRELYGGNLYTYSVKYNYKGGQIFADNKLVGTVTDVNTPVVFQSEKPEVFVSVSGKPSSKETLTGTKRVEEWGDAEYINWNFTFQLQRGGIEGNSVYFSGRIIKGGSSVKREKDIYDVETYKVTDYSEPTGRTISPGGTISLAYTSSTSNDERKYIVETLTETYSLSDDDYIYGSISFPVSIHTTTMDSESKNFTTFESGSVSELGEWKDYSVTFDNDIEVYYLPLDRPIVGSITVFRYKVDAYYGEI